MVKYLTLDLRVVSSRPTLGSMLGVEPTLKKEKEKERKTDRQDKTGKASRGSTTWSGPSKIDRLQSGKEEKKSITSSLYS